MFTHIPTTYLLSLNRKKNRADSGPNWAITKINNFNIKKGKSLILTLIFVFSTLKIVGVHIQNYQICRNLVILKLAPWDIPKKCRSDGTLVSKSRIIHNQTY